MDTHQAYELLSSTLDAYRELTSGELESLLGKVRTERRRLADGEEFLVDVEVTRYEDSPDRFRVAASADSPSTFRMERLEEQLIVRAIGSEKPGQEQDR